MTWFGIFSWLPKEGTIAHFRIARVIGMAGPEPIGRGHISMPTIYSSAISVINGMYEPLHATPRSHSRSNSYFKREQDFNIHVASHDKQPAFECVLWYVWCTSDRLFLPRFSSKSFPKKFNLNRHLRQIHDQKPVTKVRQSG